MRQINDGLFWPEAIFREAITPALAPVERGFYRLAGNDPTKEQGWLTYTPAMLVFNAAGFAILYGLMRLQAILPLNPQGFEPLSRTWRSTRL